MRLFVVILLFTIFAPHASAQCDSVSMLCVPDSVLLSYNDSDTLTMPDVEPQSLLLRPKPSFSERMDRITSTRGYQMTYIGVPLILGALIVKSEDDHFRSLRHEYLPAFRYYYDDYLQYSPAALMFGLKACGVKSRSSWGRMMVSSIFSTGITAAVVNSVKYTARVKRPDGTSRNSFPSGHTATAFMTATLLHKEYGWRSPWYSVAGYTVATFTGVSRMLNNRHWLSDVMAGAGIGILSAELGYFFADLIYKDRGLTVMEYAEPFEYGWKPSFVGFFLGLDVALEKMHPRPGISIDLRTGSSSGVEGAWFITPYLGVGGRLSISSQPFIINQMPQFYMLRGSAGLAGAYFSYPLSRRWVVGAKALAGYSYYDRCEVQGFELGHTGDVAMASGVSMMYRAKRNLGVRFFADYTLASSLTPEGGARVNLITLGSSINFIF